MSTWQLESQRSGETVVERLAIADRYLSRLAGLQFRRSLPRGAGLLLVPCGSIHTLWMRFAIAVAMLDKSGEVLAVHMRIDPWRFVFAPRGTFAVLEVATGNLDVSVGDRLILRPTGNEPRCPARLAGWLSAAECRHE